MSFSFSKPSTQFPILLRAKAKVLTMAYESSMICGSPPVLQHAGPHPQALSPPATVVSLLLQENTEHALTLGICSSAHNTLPIRYQYE